MNKLDNIAETRRVRVLIYEIVQRLETILPIDQDTYAILVLDMRLCHRRVCELDLEGLLNADDVGRMIDVFGINRYLDPEAKGFEGNFWPRYAINPRVTA